MNTKHIEFVFTGPPQADIGQLVRVIDDNGEPIEVGAWYHDGQLWRYQVNVELVPRIIVPVRASKPTRGDIGYEMGEPIAVEVNVTENDEQRKRRALKEKVMAAKQPPPPQDDWQLCPECKEKFDPRRDSLIDCMNCMEPRCTAICLPDPAGKCIVCQALEADAEEGGYDPRASKEGKGRVLGDAQAGQADDSADDDDDDDGEDT